MNKLKTMMSKKALEETFYDALKLGGKLQLHTKVTREYKFARSIGRKWRFDFAFEDIKLAIEIQGGTWKYGAHSRPRQYTKDCDKANYAIELGWFVLRYTSDMLTVDPFGIAKQVERIYLHLKAQGASE